MKKVKSIIDERERSELMKIIPLPLFSDFLKKNTFSSP